MENLTDPHILLQKYPQNTRQGVAKRNKIRIHPEYYWLGLFDIYSQYSLQLLKHFNFEQVLRKF
jgi:hypothetical protein